MKVLRVRPKHYLKGMAVYSDDLPDGVDVRFNTNKPSGTPKMKVLKEAKANAYERFFTLRWLMRNVSRKESKWNSTTPVHA